ncbi:centrobin [Heterodontus francisci]|uniref:centrobin n=1 Tax=Heterodontus francisci TaxID=7792 RepID=UPI00355C059C
MRSRSRLVSIDCCQAMNSPIRPEDLMSDVEPLPASAPSSAPASPRAAWATAAAVPCFDRSAATAVVRSLPTSPCATLTSSSEVTARLYASLQTSRDLGGAYSSSGSSHSSSSSSSSKRAETSNPKEAAERTHGPGLQSVRGDGSNSSIPGPRSRIQPPDHTSGLGSKLGASGRSRVRPGLPYNVVPMGASEITASRHPKSAQFAKDAGSAGQMAPSDLEELGVEMTQRLSKRVEASNGSKIGSRHISEMESVRSHLHSMLKFSQELTDRDAAVNPTSPTLVPKAAEEQRDNDSFESDCTSTLLSAKPFQEISVSPPMPLLGLDEAALFPRYSRMRLGTGEGPAAESSLYEYQILKDTLDKERTRRKHCEKQIQTLQNKILELQQQLAVAVSADRKKDIMIEQLDKTLVKVVEGWKKHDAEKSEAMRQLQEEHEAVEKGRGKQQQALFNLEHRLSQANQTLEKEQQEKGLLEEERGMLEEQSRKLQKVLEAEQQRCLKLQGECDKAESARLHERKRAEALHAKLGEEREACDQREKQLEQRSAQREEELQKQLEKEKVTAQREAQRAQDAQQVLSSVQTELQRLEIELDTVKREKENLQMELSLVKARFESQRVKSETEFKMALEQQVTERLTSVHEDSTRQIAAVREQHRRQILELTAQHEHEMGKQLAEFKSELQEREEKHRRTIEGYEIRLAKGQEETGRLLVVKRKLEVQRGEMVTKLQSMMQSHWNEALKVLMSDDSPRGHQRLPQPALHYDQVPIYRELNRTLSTSAATDSDLSSSSTVPYTVPASDTDRPKHSSDARGSRAPGTQAHGNLVKLHPSELPGWVSQRNDLRLRELAPDCKVSGDGFESGQLPYAHREARETVGVSAQDGCNFHGSFPQAIPLQPVVQAFSQRLASVAAKDQEFNPQANVPSSHCTVGSNAAETLNPPLKHEHYLQQADKCTSHCGNHPPVARSFLYSEQSQNQSVMLPLLPNRPSLEDLSQLLNYSFLSHASFHPLEPQVDETMMTAPGPHADELAEHPFTDDADDSGQTQDQQPSEGGTTKNSSFESSGVQSSQEQSSQSSELQYYIQMLLDRSPGEPVETSPDSEKPNVAQSDTASQQGGSPVLRDCSSDWESVRPQPMGQLATVQSSKPPSSAVQKVKINPSENVPLQRVLAPQSPQKSGSAGGVLSPKQVGELSRLLSTYYNTFDRPAPAMDELFTYLRDIQPNGPEGSESTGTSVRRNLDQKLNVMAKREGLSGQSNQKRFSANKTATEKSSCPGKPGKKPPPPTQTGSKGAKTAIWR